MTLQPHSPLCHHIHLQPAADCHTSTPQSMVEISCVDGVSSHVYMLLSHFPGSPECITYCAHVEYQHIMEGLVSASIEACVATFKCFVSF